MSILLPAEPRSDSDPAAGAELRFPLQIDLHICSASRSLHISGRRRLPRNILTTNRSGCCGQPRIARFTPYSGGVAHRREKKTNSEALLTMPKRVQ